MTLTRSESVRVGAANNHAFKLNWSNYLSGTVQRDVRVLLHHNSLSNHLAMGYKYMNYIIYISIYLL